jgi:site-specific DNA-methyltransferase (adenine-specific)
MNSEKLENVVLQGNCITVLKKITSKSINTVYMDPPFFTQKMQTSVSSDRNKNYSFSDKYESLDSYLSMIKNALTECKRVLREDGCIFLHCDKTASHYLRIQLDEVFGRDQFVNEIIWSYRRWSNSKKGLLNSHQIIFFYAVSKYYKFNNIYTDYSVTTNVDQILQERERDRYGKSIYKKDENGKLVKAGQKKGVPLSDVWEIPFLNPKAKERTGYPTQKPVELLKRIIEISTDADDIVIDPFCGSGTTCVAAKSMGRKFIGIDISEDAVALSRSRLENMVITESNLLKYGKETYIGKTEEETFLLKSLDAVPVQRNSLIDGFLKDSLVPIIIQKKDDDTIAVERKIFNLYKKEKPHRIIVVLINSKLNISIHKTLPCQIDFLRTLHAQLHQEQAENALFAY